MNLPALNVTFFSFSMVFHPFSLIPNGKLQTSFASINGTFWGFPLFSSAVLLFSASCSFHLIPHKNPHFFLLIILFHLAWFCCQENSFLQDALAPWNTRIPYYEIICVWFSYLFHVPKLSTQNILCWKKNGFVWHLF